MVPTHQNLSCVFLSLFLPIPPLHRCFSPFTRLPTLSSSLRQQPQAPLPAPRGLLPASGTSSTQPPSPLLCPTSLLPSRSYRHPSPRHHLLATTSFPDSVAKSKQQHDATLPHACSRKHLLLQASPLEPPAAPFPPSHRSDSTVPEQEPPIFLLRCCGITMPMTVKVLAMKEWLDH